MATIETTTPLPYGVGRAGARFVVLAAVLSALVVLGIVAYAYQFMEGEQVTGMRDLGTGGGAVWGLYIVFVVYFGGVAFAGVTLAAIIRLFDIERLRPIRRMAELLTVVALILAAFTVIIDLGRPVLALKNLLQYTRPQSPFFGTMSFVLSGYLVTGLVFLYLDGRRDAALLAGRAGRLRGFFRLWAAGYSDTPEERERHDRTMFWFALAIIPLLVVATSTLGFVFGLQGGAAGWFGALQAPAFVVWAGLSGIGHLIVIGAIARRFMHLENELPIPMFTWLANVLWVLIVIAFYFIIAEMLTGGYAGHINEVRVQDAVLSGDYAWLFWSMVGVLAVSLVLLFGQFVIGRYSLSALVAAAVLVNLAAIGKRYLIVVPSQTHGRLLPYEAGAYAPTWVEYAIVIGLMALGALAFAAVFKIFPIMDVATSEEGA